MRKSIWLAGLVAALALLSWMALGFNGVATYDLQSLTLLFVRVNAWLLGVIFYRALASALGDDDLEADWDRINGGNVAVALYRSIEFAVIGLAIAMLAYKI